MFILQARPCKNVFCQKCYHGNSNKTKAKQTSQFEYCDISSLVYVLFVCLLTVYEPCEQNVLRTKMDHFLHKSSQVKVKVKIALKNLKSKLF